MAISITSNNGTQRRKIELTSSDREFVDLVNNRITAFGQIPYTVSEELIVSIIKSSAKFFYKHDQKKWERKTIYIRSSDIQTYLDEVSVGNGGGSAPKIASLSGKSFIFGVQLPKKVLVVKGIKETNSQSSLAPDTSSLDQTTFGGTAGAIGINNNLFIIEKAVTIIENNMFDSVFKSEIVFDFNPETSLLTLFRYPTAGYSLVLDTFTANPVHSMYNDAYFERHVIANVKKELKRILGGHVFPLPGDVSISAEEICNNIEDAADVETIIKAGGGVGDIIMKRG